MRLGERQTNLRMCAMWYGRPISDTRNKAAFICVIFGDFHSLRFIHIIFYIRGVEGLSYYRPTEETLQH